MSKYDFTIFVICLVGAFICAFFILCVKCKKCKKHEDREYNFNMRIIPINNTIEETIIEDNYEDIINIREPVITGDENV